VERLVAENSIPSPAVMLRAAAVRAVGGYDETLTFDDYDMWMRLLSRYTLLYEPAVVVNYRILTHSLSRNTDRLGDFLLSEARMITKHADTTPTINAVIAQRLRVSAAKLLERGDMPRLRAVFGLLATVDKGWRITCGRLMSRGPIGRWLVRVLDLVESREH
jgi:hypothetical protein